MATIKEASFLGIPRELRMKIYDYVFDFNIEYTPPCGYGFRADARLQLSWLNLMLTCATTAGEIRSIMDTAAFSVGQANTSYELDLQCSKFTLTSTKWTKIPCTPSRVQDVIVHFNAVFLYRFWCDGGPMTIVSELYQTLNLLIHCGPTLDSRRPLPQLMKLRQIVIHFYTSMHTEADGELDTIHASADLSADFDLQSTSC